MTHLLKNNRKSRKGIEPQGYEPPRVNGFAPPIELDSAPPSFIPELGGSHQNAPTSYAHHYYPEESRLPVDNTGYQFTNAQQYGFFAISSKPPKTKPMPPATTIVAPFGEDSKDDLAHFDSRPSSSRTPGGAQSRTNRPTCSLSLISYSRGYTMSNVRVTKSSKFISNAGYEAFIVANPEIVTNDKALFLALKERYNKDLSGFWRRWFSLKTLKRLRLHSYTEETRPTTVPLDEFTMQEVLYAYNHPNEFGDETDWIDWVFRLRQPDKRHALEFVEGWNGTRIAFVGTVPCVLSTLLGVIWVARGGDAQTTFTVASFILTLCTVLLALLAVISGIDSKST